MLTYTKLEKFALLFLLIIYFLLLKGYFASTIYYVIAVVISIYFFPLKVILNRKSTNFLLIFGSSFLIASVIALSCISFLINEISNSLKIILLICTVLNLFFIYKFVGIDKENKILHLIAMFLIVAAFFK